MEQIVLMIMELIAKWPMLGSILAVMGMLRLIFKPLFSFLQVVVDATPMQMDNELLANFMGSNVYKWVSWFLDFVASIKLPQIQK